MKKLIFTLIIAAYALVLQAQGGYLRPSYIRWPPAGWEEGWQMVLGANGAGKWANPGLGFNDSIIFDLDTVCITDMGIEYCVSLDSIYFTDSTLCYIILPDTNCVVWNGTGLTLYTGNGVISENRIVELGSNRLRFQNSGIALFDLNFNTPSPGELLRLSDNFTSGSQAILSLENYHTTGAASDAFIRFQSTGIPGRKYCLGVDRSLSAFALAEDNDLSSDPIFQYYGVGDTLVVKKTSHFWDSIGIGVVPTRRLHVRGLMNLSKTATDYNVFINGGNATLSGTDNVVIGDNTTGDAITTGDANTIFGAGAGTALTGGSHNILIGGPAGSAITSGDANICLGWSSGGLTANMTKTIAIGYGTGINSTLGDSSVLIGYEAGRYGSSSSHRHNVLIGYRAGYQSIGSGNIFIGKGTGSGVTESNALKIDNSNTATPLIQGNFSADSVRIFGTLRATQLRHQWALDATSGVTLTTSSVNGMAMNASGAKTCALPNALASTVGVWFNIANVSSSGDITVSAPGASDVISGTLVLAPGESGIWECAVDNYWIKN